MRERLLHDRWKKNNAHSLSRLDLTRVSRDTSGYDYSCLQKIRTFSCDKWIEEWRIARQRSFWYWSRKLKTDNRFWRECSRDWRDEISEQSDRERWDKTYESWIHHVIWIAVRWDVKYEEEKKQQ